ncbi:MAG: DNA-binding response regulator [Pirellulaceae bacterium]|nr:MAG: DNA-binding response regulator [Pirellulaceae bacterium]
MAIRVLVVDDHEVVRTGLRSLLAGTDIQIVGEASKGAEVPGLVKQLRPDIVLLDIRLADGDGTKILGQLKFDYPDLPVVIFTAYDNPTYLARCVALNASGYLLKNTPKAKLVEALRKVAGGEDLWVREEMRRLGSALAVPRLPADLDVPLTERECEVLRKMAMGLTNKEIADALKISYETVKEHVQHILRKIGVTDRTQAAVWAVRKKLV